LEYLALGDKDIKPSFLIFNNPNIHLAYTFNTMEAGTDTSYNQDNDSTTEIAFSRRVLRRHKTHDRLQVLNKASLVEHGT